MGLESILQGQGRFRQPTGTDGRGCGFHGVGDSFRLRQGTLAEGFPEF